MNVAHGNGIAKSERQRDYLKFIFTCDYCQGEISENNVDGVISIDEEDYHESCYVLMNQKR